MQRSKGETWQHLDVRVPHRGWTREFDLLLPRVLLVLAINVEKIGGEGKGATEKDSHLENRGSHVRILSIWMPSQRRTKPTKRIRLKTSQRCFSASNSSYRGAKTKTSVPASRNVSAPISAGVFRSDKITSVAGKELYTTGTPFRALILRGGESERLRFF